MNPRRSQHARRAVVLDALSAQLWPVPIAAVLLAASAGVVLPRLDGRVDSHLTGTTTNYLFDGGPEAARSVLTTISGSLITVTALTFSLTVVTLQLASSQFSPRLLRTFTRDRFVHVTLALFLATFTYSLTVLRLIRTDSSDRPAFVPQISVTVAYLLALVSVVALVLFLSHLAREIRVETMLQRVHDEATETIRRTTQPRDHGKPVDAAPDVPPGATPWFASSSGFITSVDEDALLSALEGASVAVHLAREPGTQIRAGTPMGRWWSLTGPVPPTEAEIREATVRAASAVRTDFERTAAQDIGLGLRQLVDVAGKALSPGVNDPTTAVHALGHITALLCELLGRDLGPRVLRDDNDEIISVLDRPTFADLLELGVGSVRRFGAENPEVLEELYRLLRDVGWHVDRTNDRDEVARQLTRLDDVTAEQNIDDDDRARLTRLADDARTALAG